MGKAPGFKEFDRSTVPYRAEADRLLDYKEIYTVPEPSHLETQGARCMDCGVPFCQSDHGCPISNLIPEWKIWSTEVSGATRWIDFTKPTISPIHGKSVSCAL